MRDTQDARAVELDAEVRFFRGLGNAQRLRILETLFEGEKNVGQIANATGIPQSQVSAGLNCLKWCGFVASRPEGRSVYYRIADARVKQILALARAMVSRHAEQLYTCTTLTLEEGGPSVEATY
ncbi:MAG: metalloregulator ArsR/SmtB family transcription factor [Firmicutes bacterium]|nr:metalloregulator ArsR/SmtB family transcription factor [Bacillota bacterium]